LPKKESERRKAHFFEQCMALMRSRNAQKQEDGFHFLLKRAAEFVPELLAEAAAEVDDPGLRSWLYELLRETKSTLPIHHYRSLLVSTSEDERRWAQAGLKAIDTPEARKILFDAGLADQTKTVLKGHR
jgi:hypothetical protein